MEGHCDCEHHQEQHSKKKDRMEHIISLLQNNYISPYKILYPLDPKQADHFKLRNQSSGCCASNHITISDQNLTKIQKQLKQLISYSFLIGQIDAFLSYCNQKYNNIIQSGKKDNLKVTPEVEKFLIDKVMMEAINHLIFTKLSQKIKEVSNNNNKEIGLWATPATWYHRYPNQKLDFLPKEFLAALFNKGWAVLPNYTSNQRQLLRELCIMQKDGKFEQSRWPSSVKSKVMNNPEKYTKIKTSNDDYLFEQTRELIIKLSSIPFELNKKANLYCNVSPNLHFIYSKQEFESGKLKAELKYSILVIIGGDVKVTINDEEKEVESSSLLMLDNANTTFSVKNGQQQIFLAINYIGCVEKK